MCCDGSATHNREGEGRWNKVVKGVHGLEAQQTNGEIVVWRLVRGKELAGTGVRISQGSEEDPSVLSFSLWEPYSSSNPGICTCLYEIHPQNEEERERDLRCHDVYIAFLSEKVYDR